MAIQRILAEETVSVSEMRKHPADFFTDQPIAVLNKNQPIGYMIGKKQFESMVDLIRQLQPQETFSATIRPSVTQLKTIAALSNAVEMNKSGEPLDYLASIQQEILDIIGPYKLCYSG